MSILPVSIHFLGDDVLLGLGALFLLLEFQIIVAILGVRGFVQIKVQVDVDGLVVVEESNIVICGLELRQLLHVFVTHEHK